MTALLASLPPVDAEALPPADAEALPPVDGEVLPLAAVSQPQTLGACADMPLPVTCVSAREVSTTGAASTSLLAAAEPANDTHDSDTWSSFATTCKSGVVREDQALSMSIVMPASLPPPLPHVVPPCSFSPFSASVLVTPFQLPQGCDDAAHSVSSEQPEDYLHDTAAVRASARVPTSLALPPSPDAAPTGCNSNVHTTATSTEETSQDHVQVVEAVQEVQEADM
jgi:hypothetical protein